jgi:hypothetical protein
MSNDKRPTYINLETGKIRDTLVIPPHATPREVHEYFHAPIDMFDDNQPTSWSAYKARRIEPGPVRIATKAELATYNELIRTDGEDAAREWLNKEWADV